MKELKYLFYPGCVSEQLEKESYAAAKLVCDELGIGLVEDKRMSCCGATHADKVNDYLNTLVNARNLAIAEQTGMHILTICNTCFNVMKRVIFKLANDKKLLEKVNEDLEKVGLNYNGTVRVKTLLEVLCNDYGLDELKKKIRKQLDKLRVAPFYGCHIIRPSEEVEFDNPINPKSFEELIRVVGAVPVKFKGRLDCCGFHITMANPNASARMDSAILKSAVRSGANCIATPCPLCHLVMDSQQFKTKKFVGKDLGIPVLHLQQLVGLALGISMEKLMLKRHMVSCKGLYV